MATSESAVGFHKVGGHKHDGKDSTKIDFSTYDENDLKDLVKKVQKALPGNEGAEDDPATEGIPVVEGIPLSGVVSAPVNIAFMTGQNINGSSWVRVTWNSPTDTAANAGSVTTLTDDEANSYDGEVENTAPVFYEGSVESVDDTDTVDVTEVVTQSVDTTIEYQISYGRSSEFSNTEKRTFIVTDQTELQVRGLTTGVEYKFRIRGINRIGVKSDSYLEGTVTTGENADAPAAPTGLSLVMGYDTATLVWTPPAASTIHSIGGNIMTKVEISTSNTFSPLFATREVAGSTLTITGLDHHTTYYFRAKTKSAAGVYSSSWSSTASGVTEYIPGSDVTDGAAPSSSPSLAAPGSVVGGPGFFRVKWAAVSNADLVYYDVHMDTSLGFTPGSGNLCTTTPGLSTFIKQLPGGGDIAYDTDYYFKIIARDNDGSAAAGTVSSASTLLRLDGGAEIVANSITANELAVTAITTEAIASSDFATGVSGWQIHGDGTAEFNDVTVRGDIVTSSITANRDDNILDNPTFETNVNNWTVDSSSHLVLPGVATSVAYTADTADLDITADIDLIARIQFNDYTNNYQYVISKWNETGDQRSYAMGIDPSGNLFLANSTDGTAAGIVLTTSSAPSFVDGTTYWVRATIDVVSGGNRVVKFYKSTTATDSYTGVSWTQVGSTITTAGTTSIYSGSAPLHVGGSGYSGVGGEGYATGKVFAAAVLNGYDGAGTVKANVKFTDYSQVNGTLVDSTGKSWLLKNTATVIANAAISRDTGTVRTGTGAMKIDPISGTTISNSFSVWSDLMPCNGGQAFSGGAYAKSNVVTTNVLSYNLRYYTSGGTFISEDALNESAAMNSSAWFNTEDGFYLAYSTYSIAPSNAAFVRVNIEAYSLTADTDNIFVDDISLYKIPALDGLVLSNVGIHAFDYASPTVLPGGIVASYGANTDAGTTSGTLTLVSMSNIALQAGRMYKFTFHSKSVRISDDGAVFILGIYFNSGLIGSKIVTGKGTNFRANGDFTVLYSPTSDTTSSVDMTIQRNSGTGNATVTAETSASFYGWHILVEDIGYTE